MCEPTTIAYVAVALSATSAYQQSQARKDQAEYNSVVAKNNAMMAEYQAADAQQRGEQEAIAVGRKAAQLRGQQRATMAARGMDLGEGTPQSLIDQTDYFSGVDQATARGNAGKEAYARRAQAANFQTEAAMYRNAADSESPLFSAAAAGASTYASTSMLGKSGGSVADKWNFWGSSNTGGLGLKATPTSAGW